LTKCVCYSVTENIFTVSVGQMAFEIFRHINLLVTSCQFLTNEVLEMNILSSLDNLCVRQVLINLVHKLVQIIVKHTQ